MEKNKNCNTIKKNVIERGGNSQLCNKCNVHLTMCQGKFKTPQLEKKCDFFTICTSTYKHPLSNYFGIRKYHLSYNILATPEKLKIERKKERTKKREKNI